jgi:serine/threonine-protein kinase
MGTVYLARVGGAAGFRKPVVVKALHRHLMDDQASVEAFVREAKLAVRLSHPNIVPVLDFGRHEGQYVMVLEYVHGYHLGVLCRYFRSVGRRMEARHAGYVAYEVLRGLELAHALTNDRGEPLGLIHRDVSPQNILVSSDGDVRLTDFGIARVRNEATRSGRGDLKGKLAYLSPEQVTAGDVDQRADLFAVGIVLHEMLSGERLFAADSEAQTILMIHEARVPDIRVSRPDLPEEVAGILRTALARDPAERYPSASAFARDVRTLLGGASPDEVEPEFRRMIREAFSDPAFLSFSGGALPDLSTVLDGPAVSLSGDEPVSHGRAEGFTHISTAGSTRRTRFATVLALTAGVAILAALVASAVLFTAGRNRNGPGPSTPVAVIIDHRGRGDGGVGPAAATPDATTAAAPADDGGPRDADAVGDPAPATPTVVTARPDGGVAPRDRDHGARAVAPSQLDGTVVSRMIMRRRGALENCFESGLAAAGQESTSFTVRLEIRGDGSVGWAAVEPASLQATAAGQCAVGVVRGIGFPSHPDRALVFRVPITVEARQAP